MIRILAANYDVDVDNSLNSYIGTDQKQKSGPFLLNSMNRKRTLITHFGPQAAEEADETDEASDAEMVDEELGGAEAEFSEEAGEAGVEEEAGEVSEEPGVPLHPEEEVTFVDLTDIVANIAASRQGAHARAPPPRPGWCRGHGCAACKKEGGDAGAHWIWAL